MIDTFLILVIELTHAVGGLVLGWGVVLASLHLIGHEYHRLMRRPLKRYEARMKVMLGFYLQLGLEILIAADILETIVKPDLHSLIQLSVVVALRTIISFSLHWELRQEHVELRHEEDP